MIRVLLFLGLFISAAEAMEVDRAACRDLDQTTLAFVPSELRPWLQFEHGVLACSVDDGKGRFLWWIIAVDDEVTPSWADTDPVFHPLNADGFTRRCSPKPFIIDARGRTLGRISEAFPSLGEPSRTVLTLSQWVDGFPHRIAVRVFNARVMGDYDEPALQWDQKSQYFEQIGINICDEAAARRKPG